MQNLTGHKNGKHLEQRNNAASGTHTQRQIALEMSLASCGFDTLESTASCLNIQCGQVLQQRRLQSGNIPVILDNWFSTAIIRAAYSESSFSQAAFKIVRAVWKS